jgi:hypothetical protein
MPTDHAMARAGEGLDRRHTPDTQLNKNTERQELKVIRYTSIIGGRTVGR